MGIKFSARSFQVEIVGKQLMILNNKPAFQECLIKRKGSKDLEKNNTPQQEIVDDKTITIDNSLVDSADEKKNEGWGLSEKVDKIENWKRIKENVTVEFTSMKNKFIIVTY